VRITIEAFRRVLCIEYGPPLEEEDDDTLSVDPSGTTASVIELAPDPDDDDPGFGFTR